MPIYEFACNNCKNRVSVFVRSMSSPVNAKCDRCGGEELSRLISKVTVLKSGDYFDSFDDDRMLSGFDENDPRAMAAWARKMQREMGEDMGPEFEQMVEQMEQGGGLPDGFGSDDGFGDDDFDDI